jgi:hypothetical protein
LDVSPYFKIKELKFEQADFLVDLGHQFSNIVKHIIVTVTNKPGKLSWSVANREFEQITLGRFLAVLTSKAPWHLSAERLEELTWLCTMLRYSADVL